MGCCHAPTPATLPVPRPNPSSSVLSHIYNPISSFCCVLNRPAPLFINRFFPPPLQLLSPSSLSLLSRLPPKSRLSIYLIIPQTIYIYIHTLSLLARTLLPSIQGFSACLLLPSKIEMPSAVRTRYDSGDSDSPDPYAADDFRMYEFKVRRCTRGRTHDWTDCPFAHPGEKACRRDPRRYHYSGAACPEFRRNSGCRRGDACHFAHGVFESWLHPTRYRTQPCRDGRGCRRKVCFFAHTPAQLRLLPSSDSTSSSPSPPSATAKTTITAAARNAFCSCAFCPCKSASATQLASSPTSTLMGLSHLSSPPLSPPLSPVYSPPVDCRSYHGVLSYKSLLTDLVSSLEAMDLSAVASPSASASSNATIDPFLLSPASSSNSRDYSYMSYGKNEMNNDINADGSGFSNNNIGCPDLDWVNELVM